MKPEPDSAVVTLVQGTGHHRLLLDKSALSKERDMPWELSDAEKSGGPAIPLHSAF